ncbi:hypothetical protein [Methylobacterium oryzisoli]|uniref:hypothetical protein n=1 Tax=Methylobacterium oryzisoli TaxID=3385502 RepID=UPI003891CB64
MPDLDTETRHLARADRAIAAGERRIAEQVERIAHLRRCDLSIAAAEQLLHTLRQTLIGWQDTREEIRRTIARIEAVARPGPAPQA